MVVALVGEAAAVALVVEPGTLVAPLASPAGAAGKVAVGGAIGPPFSQATSASKSNIGNSRLSMTEG
jgi:hypothetical protein